MYHFKENILYFKNKIFLNYENLSRKFVHMLNVTIIHYIILKLIFN